MYKKGTNKTRKEIIQEKDAGLVEKYKMKMNLPSTLKGFMSLMNRISLQKQCFIFVRNNNA